MEKVFRDLLLARSGEERMKMGFSMTGMAKRQVAASVLESDPGASPDRIRVEVFFRFHEGDFSAREIAEMMGKLKNKTGFGR